MLDFKVFWEIFNLMIKYRHKLFDDEYFKGDKPYIQRVYEIIEAHIPYFWVFYDKITAEILGFAIFTTLFRIKSLYILYLRLFALKNQPAAKQQ